MAAREHLSADEVWARVRQRMPQISRATVYRNLQKLVRQGALTLVHLGKRAVCFDVTLHPHDHFVCRVCGAVQDVPADEAGGTLPAALPQGSLVQGRSVTWYGVCVQCRTRPHGIGLAGGMPGRMVASLR